MRWLNTWSNIKILKAKLQIFVHFIYKEYKYCKIRWCCYENYSRYKIFNSINYVVSFVSINVLITCVLYLLHYVPENLSKFCQFLFFISLRKNVNKTIRWISYLNSDFYPMHRKLLPKWYLQSRVKLTVASCSVCTCRL